MVIYRSPPSWPTTLTDVIRIGKSKSTTILAIYKVAVVSLTRMPNFR